MAEQTEKLIVEQDKPKEYFLFHVVVNNTRMEVWRRNETHSLGELNGKPNNWWVRYNNQWIPWVDCGTNRPSWDISISIQNKLSYKYNDYAISSCGKVEIKCNLRTVYSFFASDLDYAFSEARSLIFKMEDHPFNFMDPEKEIGRAIYYYNQPAIIHSLSLGDGEIYIQYAGKGKGFDLTNPWDKDSDWPTSEWNGKSLIRDDIFSPKIYWFRK